MYNQKKAPVGKVTRFVFFIGLMTIIMICFYHNTLFFIRTHFKRTPKLRLGKIINNRNKLRTK